MLNIDHAVAVLLNTLAAPEARCSALQRLRRHAAQHLQDACERVGITVADLADNDRAVVASLLFRKAAASSREHQAAVLMRWCIEAQERIDGTLDASFDGTPICMRIVLALRDMEGAIASEQQGTARAVSKAARVKQATAEAAALTDVFKAAYSAGMGRTKLQAAAVVGLRTREQLLREKLTTAQQAGNKKLQRQLSAELTSVDRQVVLCTVHRAGRWLQQHHGKA